MSKSHELDAEMGAPLIGNDGERSVSRTMSMQPHKEKSSSEKIMWTVLMLVSGTFTTLVAKG
jgi:hypothetical protein